MDCGLYKFRTHTSGKVEEERRLYLPTRLGLMKSLESPPQKIDDLSILIGSSLQKQQAEYKQFMESATGNLRDLQDLITDFKAELIEFAPGGMRDAAPDDFKKMKRKRGASGLVNPNDVTVAFLGILLKEILDDLRETPSFIDAKFVVHLSQPAIPTKLKTQQKRPGIHERRYERNFVEYIFPNLEKALNASGYYCDFPGKHEGFTFEPNAVYQHASATILSGREVKNVLIIDIGGATTDLSWIEVKSDLNIAVPHADHINIAGNSFDRLLLKHIKYKPDAQQLTNQEIDQVTQIEDVMTRVREAKERISRGTPKVEMQIRERSVIMDAFVLENAFDEWWSKLDEGIEKFVAYTKVEIFDAVLMAGGMSQLSWLQKWTQNAGATFAEPDNFLYAHDVECSTLTAQGMALLLMPDLPGKTQLIEANHLLGKFVDDLGRFYPFKRKVNDREVESQLSDKREGYPIAWIDELMNEDEFSFDDFESFSRTQYQHTPAQSIRLEIRTNISNEWVKADEVTLSHSQDQRHRYFGYSFSASNQVNEIDEMGNPWLGYNHHSKYGTWHQKLSKNHHKLGESSRNPRIKLPLCRSKARDNVHIFIDLGMTNTAVAVYAPGKSLPEESFQSIDIGNSRKKSFVDNGIGNGQDDQLMNGLLLQSNSVPEAVTEVLSEDVIKDPVGLQPKPLQTPLNTEESGYIKDLSVNLDSPIAGHRFESQPASAIWIKQLVEGIGDKLERLAIYLDERKSETTVQKSSNSNIKSLLNPNEEYLTSGRQELGGTIELRSFIKNERVNGEKRRYFYSSHILKDVWAQVINDDARLTILAGPPGSGKSTLVRLLAGFANRPSRIDSKREKELIEASVVEMNQSKGSIFYHHESVSPTWYSPRPLLGGYSELDRVYRITRFLKFLKAAEQNYRNNKDKDSKVKPRLFFVCLDEFNLSHPEQYLSDILSNT